MRAAWRVYSPPRSSLPSATSRFTLLRTPLVLLSLVSLLSTAPFTTMAAPANSSSSPPAATLLSRSTIIPPRVAHHSTVIFLHGLGDSSNGFRGMFASFSLPYTRIVLPNAPTQPVTVNGGMRMQSWYDIYSLDRRNPINTREDRTGILRSRDALEELIKTEAELVGGAERVVIGGFSQGAAMSIITGLSSRHHLAGVVALSGYLLLRDDYPALLSPHAKEVPVFGYHGKDDQTVPYAIGQLSFEKLKALGVKATFEGEVGLGHSVSEEEVAKVLAFIQQRVAAHQAPAKKGW